ncbi:MAG: sigma-70 family RNA polymerase sigma factor [Planctomycetota bacterium]
MHAPGQPDDSVRGADASVPDDATLLHRARAGDHGALGALLRRHERRLFNVALGVLGNRADAQDATQDAFVSVVRRLDQFRGDATFGTWVTRIVLNASKDLLRKRQRRPATPFSVLSQDDDGSSAAGTRFAQSRELPPGTHVENQEQHQRLREAVAALDGPFRDVLVLRDLDGMDYADIAETLELPMGTVKSRLFRARLMLREALRLHIAAAPAATPHTA